MFRYFRRLAALVRNRPGLFGFPPVEPPRDPHAPVRHPRGYKPGGRSSASAVEEPRDPNLVRAVSRSRSR